MVTSSCDVYVFTFISASVASENSICLLGDCAPHAGELATHEALTPPAACGASCGSHPTCAAWVTLTNIWNKYCYRYSSCPDKLVNRNIVVLNKRIYTCHRKLQTFSVTGQTTTTYLVRFNLMIHLLATSV